MAESHHHSVPLIEAATACSERWWPDRVAVRSLSIVESQRAKSEPRLGQFAPVADCLVALMEEVDILSMTRSAQATALSLPC